MNDQGMNSDQIAQVFGALGRIEQKIDGTTAWMATHSAEDKKNFETISNDVVGLKLAHARQKGFMTALAGAGAFISGIVGYGIEYFVSGRGHH
jgi:hypothetical protein